MIGSKRNTQFPAPRGPYKVSLKNSVPWQEFATQRIQISIGNANTEGDKFFALCEWAAARFERVSLIVSDTLQRHNLGFEEALSMPGAWALARSSGDAWLLRNADALRLLPEARMVRWDNLLADPRYAPALSRLQALSKQESAFAAAIDATVEAFWRRNAERLGSVRRGRFDASSKAFLLEELAVFTFLCADAGLDAYAGSWLEGIFTVLRAEPEAFFDAFRRDWLQVDFTRNKSFSGLALARAA